LITGISGITTFSSHRHCRHSSSDSVSRFLFRRSQ